MGGPDLPIGTRLTLIEPEPPIGAEIAEHKRDVWEKRVACGRCAYCVGIPEGSDFPWNEISVVAWDVGAGELIVQPITFSNVSSPRRVHVDDLLDLYDVEAEGDTPDGWVTPLTEIGR